MSLGYCIPTNLAKGIAPMACISCHNPSLGLATKARACKGAAQEGSLGLTSHAPGSVEECEGMNPHIPK